LDANGEHNFEVLAAMDLSLFDKDIKSLLAGEETDLPRFDFLTGHKVFGERLTKITPEQPIVIEGLHALNPEMTGGLPDEEKFRIYISPLTQLNIDDHNRIPTTDVRLLRRMLRDSRTRGHSAEETLLGWQKVRKGEEVSVFPYVAQSDVVFNSALLYELTVLHPEVERLLKELPKGSLAEQDAKALLELLACFTVMPEDEIKKIPEDSILREFIG
jgi:uridine kinase